MLSLRAAGASGTRNELVRRPRHWSSARCLSAKAPRGICRVTGLSLTWLLQFIAELYAQLPDDLGVRRVSACRRIHLLRLEAKVDELWSACRQ